MEELRVQLEVSLKILEESLHKTMSTSGFNHECEIMMMLKELIKEQISSENSSYPTG